MFNIGGSEVLVIALIALVVVGPEQLPSVLRKAGKEMARLRSMTSSIRDEFMAGVEELDPTTWDNAPRTPAKPISTPEEFHAHLDDAERLAEERALGEAGRQQQEDKFSASAAKSGSLPSSAEASSDGESESVGDVEPDERPEVATADVPDRIDAKARVDVGAEVDSAEVDSAEVDSAEANDDAADGEPAIVDKDATT